MVKPIYGITLTYAHKQQERHHHIVYRLILKVTTLLDRYQVNYHLKLILKRIEERSHFSGHSHIGHEIDPDNKMQTR